MKGLKMTDTAITYARVSGDDRSKDDRNLAGQLEMCREYSVKRGYYIIEELAEDDRGASGASFELVQLNKILDLARNHSFDVLVVREVDRLSRNLAKQLIVEEWLKREGVRIEYVLGEYPDTPEGNLMKNIRATAAEFERLKIVERNKRGRRLKAEAGSVVSHGQATYGYRLIRSGNKMALEIHEQEAAIVGLIFQWYTEGDGDSPPIAARGIAKKLSALRVPTYQDVKNAEHVAAGKSGKYGRKRREFGEWGNGTIANILSNESYTGVWHYGKRGADVHGKRFMHGADNLIAVQIPAIISLDVWEAAQARIIYNRETSAKNQKYEYLLAKRVYCGECNCKMHAVPNHSKGKLHFYFMCKAKREYTIECNNNTTYSMRNLDSQVWEWVSSLLSDSNELQRGLDEYKTRQESDLAPLYQRLTVLDDLLQENHLQLDRLLDLYLSGDFPKEALTERKSRLEETISSLQRECATIMEQLDNRVTTEQEQAIKSLAMKIGKEVLIAGNRFEIRRQIIELLDVTAVLSIKNGQKIAEVSCVLGDCVFELISNRRKGNGEESGGLLSVNNSTVMK
jgi:site-specific DNA recombinase